MRCSEGTSEEQLRETHTCVIYDWTLTVVSLSSATFKVEVQNFKTRLDFFVLALANCMGQCHKLFGSTMELMQWAHIQQKWIATNILSISNINLQSWRCRLLNTTTKTQKARNILFHHGRETPFVVLIFLLSRPSIDVGQQRFLLSLQCIAIIKGIMWRTRHTIQGWQTSAFVLVFQVFFYCVN